MFKQPIAGILATLLIIALSLGFISLFSFEWFTGWVSYSLMCAIPISIMIGVIWGRNSPEFITRSAQPAKGLYLIGITLLGGVIAGCIMFYTIGGGLQPLAPMLVHFTITVIGTMFWLTIIMGGWPIVPRIKHPVIAGLAIVLLTYIISLALFYLFYNYAFLIGTPVYVASLDPNGLFNGWNVTVFYVSFISIMFVILHFDLWPLVKFPALMKQPVLGIAFTLLALCLTSLLYYLGVILFKINVVSFMVLLPIPFVFGSVIVLNMLQDSLFPNVRQPVKGLLKVSLALVTGIILANLFIAFSGLTTKELGSGPPTFEREIWLSSALLSITFPFLIFLADYFQFGGLLKKNNSQKP